MLWEVWEQYTRNWAHRPYRAMQARSIAEIPEPELVQMLSGHPELRLWLFDPFLTGPSDRIFLRVPFVELAETRYRDGDVDAILLPRGEAGSAVAYQQFREHDTI